MVFTVHFLSNALVKILIYYFCDLAGETKQRSWRLSLFS